ncbi:MAG TPA: hypothetical protein VNO51_00560 [Ilumatobacteraceae bacterium]|nr:hypothetical protein [Ilumatobacteraceae bacterium]
MPTALTIAAIVLGSTVAGGPAAVAAPPIEQAAAQTPASAYASSGSFRLADTRSTDCGCTLLDATTMRVDVGGRFGIPDGITAAVVTVTATNITADSFLTAYPAGEALPNTSIVNPRRDHDVGNTAIVPVGVGGAVDIRSTIAIASAIDVVVDVAGFFVPADAATQGRFVPATPERILDTRRPGSPTGRLAPGGSVVVPRPAVVPADSLGLVLNVTSVEASAAGFLNISPTNGTGTPTSFMNPDGSGDPLAAFVIAALTADGLTIHATSGGHVIVDLIGWFTGPSAESSSEGLFVPIAPTRRLDTRDDPRNVGPVGAIEVGFAGLVPSAAAVATNVTLDRTDDAGYLTAYPAGTALPDVSTVNSTRPADTIANAAITRLSTRGTAYFSDRGTDVIVDVTGYFTGAPVAATLPVPPLDNGSSRVLLVGDSTLLAVGSYGLLHAFQGFDDVYEAASCRTLGVPSCGRNPVPNSVATINAAVGRFDAVVIMAGYDEWWTTFPDSFEAVNDAARAKGARRIIWLSYREGVGYKMPDGSTANEAFVKNNQTLREKVASGANPDVVLANWYGYTTATPTWLSSDGIHLTFTGAYGVADYISRTIANLEGRPCPQPWVDGGPIDSPCPAPDAHGPPADVVSLYR